MNSTSEICGPLFYDEFGPHLSGCSDHFDFTLLFEQSIFSLGPSIILLILCPIRFVNLYSQERKTRPGLLQWAKQGSIIIFFGLQVALLVLWALPSSPKTRVSIAAAVFSVIGAAFIYVLSTVEHIRSVRPSDILIAFLTLSALFDITQARTLWLLSTFDTIAATFTASLAVKVLLLGLEIVEKRSFLIPPYENLALESTGGLFNRSVFWWLNSLFWHGASSLLSFQDLPNIEDKFSSESLQRKLKKNWIRYATLKKWRLMLAALATFKWSFLSALIPRLCFIGFTYAQPFLINRAVDFVGESSGASEKNVGYGLIGATALIYIGITLSRSFYVHQTYRAITMFRGAFVCLIYEKSLKQTLETQNDLAPVTLMSTDIDSIATGLQTVHDTWASCIEVGLGLFLLDRQVGTAFVFVLIPAAVCAYLTSYVCQFMGPARMEWNGAVQKRVGITSSVLGQLKALKMKGLTEHLSKNLQSLRVSELKFSKKFRMLIFWLNLIANVSNSITPVAVIAAAVFWSRSNNENLTVAEAFTALAILSLISNPLNTLMDSYSNLAGSLGSLQRIQEYLISEEQEDCRVRRIKETIFKVPHTTTNEKGEDSSSETPSSSTPIRTNTIEEAIKIEGGNFGLAPRETFVLREINLKLRRSTFTAIIGPVGSGKSTLLKALVGEISGQTSSVYVANESLSYCDQTPWILNTTIQENIVGVSDFDEKWYASVVFACALTDDIARFPDGNLSVVGTGGIALSGGQKQRLALARAVYARTSLVILDDVFSGLDNVTASLIFERLFSPSGLFRQLQCTVILATHTYRFLSSADQIIVLGTDGKISAQGSFEDLKYQEQNAQIFSAISSEQLPGDGEVQRSIEEPKIITTARENSFNPIEENIKRQTGDFSVYKYYLKSIGLLNVIIFLVLATAYIFLGKLPQIWLRIWTEGGISYHKGLNFGLFTVFSVACVVGAGAAVRFWLVYVVPKTGENLHLVLLKSVMRATFSYISNTDNGVILNRFSQDMSLLDQALPLAAFTTTFDVLTVIAEIALIASGAQYVAAIIPFSIAAIYFLQKFYLKTSRQLRYLDLEAKSPLYTHFTETLAGLSTIRAFGWQDSFQKRLYKHLDFSQKPYYLLFCIQRWLNVALDLFVAAIAIVLVAFAVEWTGTSSRGAIGLALLNLLGFNSSLSMLINSWTTLETSLGAIARLKDFVRDTPCEVDVAAETVDNQLDLKNWPTAGEIIVQNLSASYSPNSELVLSDISLKINSGEKICICGRTGSGKSSIILSILRLLTIRQGKIFIDGVDLSTIPLQTIRSRIVTIPQEPIILPGTLRFNLDPTAKINDNTMISALQKLGLWDLLSERSTGEQGPLDESMENISLSHGQYKLLSLASAILRNEEGHGKILILDEIASNVDAQTDESMQRIIEECFADWTVITVAHRLERMGGFDKVAVVDRGMVVEFDSPEVLRMKDNSAFGRLLKG